MYCGAAQIYDLVSSTHARASQISDLVDAYGSVVLFAVLVQIYDLANSTHARASQIYDLADAYDWLALTIKKITATSHESDGLM